MSLNKILSKYELVIVFIFCLSLACCYNSVFNFLNKNLPGNSGKPTKSNISVKFNG